MENADGDPFCTTEWRARLAREEAELARLEAQRPQFLASLGPTPANDMNRARSTDEVLQANITAARPSCAESNIRSLRASEESRASLNQSSDRFVCGNRR
jgi:hypothetical protein